MEDTPSAPLETLDFSLYPLRFHFVARDRIWFGPAGVGNALRGALGYAIRQLSCPGNCPAINGLPTAACALARECAYARLFEPPRRTSGASGLADSPRPFLIRPSRESEEPVNAGALLSIDLHYFGSGAEANADIAIFQAAFASLAENGLGPARGRATFNGISRIDGQPLEAGPLNLSLSPAPHECARVSVEFLTPTELKAGGQIVQQPHFGVLLDRIRDRVSTLRALYGAGPLKIDFRGMGERAALIRMESGDWTSNVRQRRSSRTGLTHGIGGFTGRVEYSGALTEFVPWLRVAEWTGVGRQTTWGKGNIRVGTFDDVTHKKS